jgi:hypothetical protein
MTPFGFGKFRFWEVSVLGSVHCYGAVVLELLHQPTNNGGGGAGGGEGGEGVGEGGEGGAEGGGGVKGRELSGQVPP